MAPRRSFHSAREQEQIRRAAEIGVEATSPEDIELVPLDDGAAEKADEIREHIG